MNWLNQQSNISSVQSYAPTKVRFSTNPFISPTRTPLSPISIPSTLTSDHDTTVVGIEHLDMNNTDSLSRKNNHSNIIFLASNMNELHTLLEKFNQIVNDSKTLNCSTGTLAIIFNVNNTYVKSIDEFNKIIPNRPLSKTNVRLKKDQKSSDTLTISRSSILLRIFNRKHEVFETPKDISYFSVLDDVLNNNLYKYNTSNHNLNATFANNYVLVRNIIENSNLQDTFNNISIDDNNLILGDHIVSNMPSDHKFVIKSSPRALVGIDIYESLDNHFPSHTSHIFVNNFPAIKVVIPRKMNQTLPKTVSNIFLVNTENKDVEQNGIDEEIYNVTTINYYIIFSDEPKQIDNPIEPNINTSIVSNHSTADTPGSTTSTTYIPGSTTSSSFTEAMVTKIEKTSGIHVTADFYDAHLSTHKTFEMEATDQFTTDFVNSNFSYLMSNRSENISFTNKKENEIDTSYENLTIQTSFTDTVKPVTKMFDHLGENNYEQPSQPVNITNIVPSSNSSFKFHEYLSTTKFTSDIPSKTTVPTTFSNITPIHLNNVTNPNSFIKTPNNNTILNPKNLVRIVLEGGPFNHDEFKVNLKSKLEIIYQEVLNYNMNNSVIRNQTILQNSGNSIFKVHIHNSTHIPSKNQTEIIYGISYGNTSLKAYQIVDKLQNIIHNSMSNKLGYIVLLNEGE